MWRFTGYSSPSTWRTTPASKLVVTSCREPSHTVVSDTVCMMSNGGTANTVESPSIMQLWAQTSHYPCCHSLPFLERGGERRPFYRLFRQLYASCAADSRKCSCSLSPCNMMSFHDTMTPMTELWLRTFLYRGSATPKCCT